MLVSVFLPGGCDLLDTLPPIGAYGQYADLRNGMKLEAPPALGATGLGIHPSLAEGLNGGVKGLFDAGKVGFMPGIDYANPDLSHFHSRHFWETGLVTERAAPGWLGRWLDHHGSRDNPLQGLSLSSTLSPVLATASAPVAALESPNDVGLDIWGIGGQQERQMREAWARMSNAHVRGDGPEAVHTAAQLAKSVGDRLAPYAEHDDVDPLAPAVAYPEDDDLGRRLSRVAALVAQPLGVRLASVDAERRVRHARQPADRAGGLAEIGLAVARRLPGRPRGARRCRPRADARVVGVRPPPGGQRVERHRPWRRRDRLGAGHARGLAGSSPSTRR